MPLASVDRLSAEFEKNIEVVVTDLTRRIIDILGDATTNGAVDAAFLLASRAQLLQALTDSGYYGAIQENVDGYEGLIAGVTASAGAAAVGLKFTSVDAELLQMLASADIQGAEFLGVEAVDK